MPASDVNLMTGGHAWAEDATVADRVRSGLGPVLKALDGPHVHVAVADGVVSLHGDVADRATRAAVEASVLSTSGVRGIDSHLHLGLLPSDTRPSTGRRRIRRSRPSVDRLTARDVMTDRFFFVSPDDSPFAAYDLITKHHVHHLPVIADDGRCLAILDSVAAIARASETLLHNRGKLLELQGLDRPLCVLPDTPLQRVATEMTWTGTDACGVVDRHGRLLGLITARDVVAAVAGERPRTRRSR